MKILYSSALLVLTALSACNKNSNDLTQTAVAAADPAPTAGFKILNSEDGQMREGRVLQFDNSSLNGVSYKWDFGNDVYSTEKNPSDISLVPCGQDRTITLTVTNAAGKAAVYSSVFYVYCFKGPGAKHVNH